MKNVLNVYISIVNISKNYICKELEKYNFTIHKKYFYIFGIDLNLWKMYKIKALSKMITHKAKY